MKTVIAYLLLSFLLVSCAREYGIEKRAKQQLPVSLEYSADMIERGAHQFEIEELKTVYANDSICLLQFQLRFLNDAEKPQLRDYRYTYMIDLMMSRTMHQPVFLEKFSNILCLPDDLIKQCRKDVEESGESVYDNAIGSCFPVQRAFDAESR